MIQRTLPVLFAALAHLVAGAAARAQSWEELGGSASGDGISQGGANNQEPEVAVNPVTGRPTVAWFDTWGGGGRVLVTEWRDDADPPSWRWGSSPYYVVVAELPSSACMGLSLDFDSQGRVLVAFGGDWYEDAERAQVRLLRAAPGGDWEGLGTSASPGGIDQSPGMNQDVTLVVDESDNPWVCWRELVPGENTYGVHLRRWNPVVGSWVQVGGSATGLGISALSDQGLSNANHADLAWDPLLKRPVVAWVDWNAAMGRQVYVAGWDPATRLWTGFGGSESGDGATHWPHSNFMPFEIDLKVDPAGRPCLAWSKLPVDSEQHRVFFTRWDGTAWAGLGGSEVSGIDGTDSSLSGTAGVGLAIGPDGGPQVAWTLDDGSQSVLCIRHWQGGAWLEIAGSATGAGLVDGEGTTGTPGLVVDEDGDRFVVWTRNPGTGASIRLLACFNPPPPDPAYPAQYLLDGITQIPPGGLTDGGTGFVARASASDPDGGLLLLQVEVRIVGADPSSPPAASATGSPGAGPGHQVEVAGLVLGTAYRWRVRTLDAFGVASGWTDFGTADPAETDIVARDNSAPVAEVAGLFRSDGTPVGPSSTLFSGGDSIVLQAAMQDADGDAAEIHVEVRPLGEAFTGLPTSVGAGVSAGGFSAASIALETPGSYRVQTRAVDGFGAAGPWLPLGANGAEEADFVVMSNGSVGGKFCGGAAGTSLPCVTLLVLLAGRVFGPKAKGRLSR